MYELEAARRWHCKKVLSDEEAARVIRDLNEEDPAFFSGESYEGKIRGPQQYPLLDMLRSIRNFLASLIPMRHAS